MEGFEYKMIHAINFKCITCQKKYATEDGMKKHIRFTHAVQAPTSVHYESFVGVRKVKVPTNQGATTTSTSKPTDTTVHQVEFPLAPMGVLAPVSAHAGPSAQPPIGTIGNFPARVSAEFPSNISPNPSEVISKVSEVYDNF